ncbi:beta-N-acetylhexosaminidase [Alteromonas sediminis]|uniref:Beta-hexosaminidase n=1 Tax=Alteromonas sediminis TaxID=2259342 RepID=A0A3N5Y122_9ALTE|nr:beta-N-acetylhexosaminidase [Alteromonas sediminis]RPJ67252.1 beta-N-acetylhexosaminidase [Alteromonas sediminis]
MQPLVIDFAGTKLTSAEIAHLQHPLVGGVILFTRNFENGPQLKALTAHIHKVRPDIFIGVDHEGGRVQRFRDGFTALPAMGCVTEEEAFACGIIMAYELQAHGIDLSFAPVLDRDNGSRVIGDRGFSESVDIIENRASALIKGLHTMGFPACGKHFPGHGSVEADSHIDCPVDNRTASEIKIDMQPFHRLISKGMLDGIMPAHVIYSHCDALPAGYSPFWLQQTLRDELNFKGVIFSDDLSMEGASVAGSYAQRAEAAYEAGCDYLLLCNAPEQVEPVLTALEKLVLRPSPSLSKSDLSQCINRQQYYDEALNVLRRNQQ